MIYNDQFIWLHFPKCAGTKIEYLFNKYFADQSDLHLDESDYSKNPTISWHDSIANRQQRDSNFNPGDRTIICSFRRLPGWLESRYKFEYHRSPGLDHDPNLLLKGLFLESDGNVSQADYYAFKYFPKELLKSGKLKFLRTEYFEEDFKAIFSEFLDISKIPQWEYQQKINDSEGNLPDEVKEIIMNQQNKIYKHCPYWRKVEKLAYSNKSKSKLLFRLFQ